MENCPFCPMFEGIIEDYIDIEPLNPIVKGHRIIIPREHVKDFSEWLGGNTFIRVLEIYHNAYKSEVDQALNKIVKE